MIEPANLGIPGLTNIERIGAGGNAVVYRARQADLDRDVVVKVLLAADSEATRRRFDRERRAMGRLSQASGIAPLYDTGFTSSNQPYLLMPFYEQGSLQHAVATRGALPADEVRQIGVTVSRAVQIAHENGVLHRDLKPANILMTRSGQPDVADFGIAHLVDDALGTSQALTMTPLYTAPEVFDGVESGASSDVYSLGATLYAVLNGYPAFSDPDGSTPMLALMRRINEDPLPKLPAHVPVELATVIAKAMSKQPGDRQTSAGQLADELAAADLTPPKPPSAARPSRVVLIAALAVMLAAVGGVAAAFLLARGDDPTERVEPAVTGVATSSVTTTTPVSPGDPAPDAVPFDVAAARATASQALVRIEAFSCTGAQVATGVVVNDGVIITTDRVANSPWHVDVIFNGAVLPAQVQASMITDGFASLVIEDPSVFDVLPGLQVTLGDQVALVGIDGRPAVATIAAGAADDLYAEVNDEFSGNAIEPADIVVSDSGALVGIASVRPGLIEVITPDRLLDEPNVVTPSYACPTLRRDLSAVDAESAVSPAVAELLTMQQLSDAYAKERWTLVRQLEPGKAGLADQQFINGWRPLRQGFVFPVERMLTNGNVARWRIGLIGHETWSGTDLTTLFCVTWTVDPVSGAVVQTNEDNVLVFGSQAGQPQQLGFVDPSELRVLIDDNCQLP